MSFDNFLFLFKRKLMSSDGCFLEVTVSYEEVQSLCLAQLLTFPQNASSSQRPLKDFTLAGYRSALETGDFEDSIL